MKFNQWTIGLAAMLAGVLVLGSGCSTTTTQVVTANPNGTFTTNVIVTHQFDAAKTVKVMNRVVPQAVVYADKAAPQYRQYIVDAQVAACALVGSTNVTPADLKVVFAQTGITTIQTPEIEDAVATIYGLYSDFYDQLVAAHLPQDQIVANMTLIIQGLCDSLSAGLAQSPPPETAPPLPAIETPLPSPAATNTP